MVSAILVLGLATTTLLLAWSLLGRKSPPCKPADRDKNRQDVDIQILRSLLDRNEFHYLHDSLSPKDFHNLLRRRIDLTLEILRVVEENANRLTGVEQFAMAKSNSGLPPHNDELLSGAVQLRLNLLLARFCLRLEWLFPSWSFVLPEWIKPYRHLLNSLEQCGAHPTA